MSDVAVAVAECSPLSCVAVREWHATVWSWRERNGFGRGVREMRVDAYTEMSVLIGGSGVYI